MFSEEQIQVIKLALTECDSLETKALIGDVPLKYQFTQEFEEKAEALKRRVTLRMKTTVKSILIAAIIACLILAASVAIMAGVDDSYIVLFGNNTQEYMTSDSAQKELPLHIRPAGDEKTLDIPTLMIEYDLPAGDEKTLDIPALMIEYDLPAPEGYVITSFNPSQSNYSLWFSKNKSDDAGYWHMGIKVNIYEIFEDTNVKFVHNGVMNSMEFGDHIMYYYDDSQTAEGSDFHSDSTHYIVKGDKYVANISTSVHTYHTDEVGPEDMPKPEEIAKIFEAIDEMLHAPMRSFEEIVAEPEPSESSMLSGTLGLDGKPETAIDFSKIKYRYLPVPEDYVLKRNNGGIIITYQKQYDYPTVGPTLKIEMIDKSLDPYAGMPSVAAQELNVLGITMHYHTEPIIYDGTQMKVYLYNCDTYAIKVQAITSVQHGADELPTHEEIATVINALNDALS